MLATIFWRCSTAMHKIISVPCFPFCFSVQAIACVRAPIPEFPALSGLFFPPGVPFCPGFPSVQRPAARRAHGNSSLSYHFAKRPANGFFTWFRSSWAYCEIISRKSSITSSSRSSRCMQMFAMEEKTARFMNSSSAGASSLTSLHASGRLEIRILHKWSHRSHETTSSSHRRICASPVFSVSATARKIAVLFYNTLRHGMTYKDPGASHYEERYRNRVLGNLQRRAKAFGFVLQEDPAPDKLAVS